MIWIIFLSPLQCGLERGAFHSASPETKEAILMIRVFLAERERGREGGRELMVSYRS